MSHFEIWHEVAKRIQNPNEACRFVGHLMEHCKDKTFNELVTTNFTNSANQLQTSVSQFCSECNKTFNLRAIYLEMNGFDVNTDRWYFDLFGYENLPEDNNSLEWLCHWQSPNYPDVTLTGLETIQKLYENYMKIRSRQNLDEIDKELAYNNELATLMIMAKFCKLIDESLDNKLLHVHIYATAHDFDTIFHKSA